MQQVISIDPYIFNFPATLVVVAKEVLSLDPSTFENDEDEPDVLIENLEEKLKNLFDI